MIVLPKTQKQCEAMIAFLAHHALVRPTIDMHMVGWVSDERLKVVVGMNAALGKTCQIHVACAPDHAYTPMDLVKFVFNYAFNTLKREMLIGVVNSLNKKALRYDEHLGFKEILRLPKMHDDDGDMVIFGMTRAECRYIDVAAEVVTGEAA